MQYFARSGGKPSYWWVTRGPGIEQRGLINYLDVYCESTRCCWDRWLSSKYDRLHSWSKWLLTPSLSIEVYRSKMSVKYISHISWLCAWGGCTIICCRFHIYPRKSGFFFFLILCSIMMCANNRVHNGLMVIFVCLHFRVPHYHHNAGVTESNELLKCLSGSFYSYRVCV